MYILGFVIGTILGSLVKALADRSLKNKSYWGRSHCQFCKAELRWYDLLPIVSYLILGGKCRYCRKAVNIEYLLIEVVMGVLVGFLFWQSFQNFQPFDFTQGKFSIFVFELIFKTFFITILAILFLTDLKKMLIPDRIVLPAIVISIIFITFITIIKVGYLYYYLSQTPIGQKLLPPYSDYFQRHALMAAQPLLGSLLMAVLIGAFFWGLIVLTKGKGMGGGDVKLGAFIGLGLGFPYSLVTLMLAFLSGAVFSLALILTGKKHFGQTIAFGPFLVTGALIALYWGQIIVDWYLSLDT